MHGHLGLGAFAGSQAPEPPLDIMHARQELPAAGMLHWHTQQGLRGTVHMVGPQKGSLEHSSRPGRPWGIVQW